MYQLLKQEGRARRGEFTTVHGTVQTPAFMNVATSAAIKGGISSLDLARKIPGGTYCPDLEGVTARLAELARPGDLILTVGAGDIYLAGEALLEAVPCDPT